MSKAIVRYNTLQIQLSELCQPTVTVPLWETPVLVAVHGDNVVEKGSFVVDRELPEAGDEFTRLAMRYGPKNSDTPYVAGVYGNFGPGVNALEREIEKSVTSRRQIAIEAREQADAAVQRAQDDAAQREAEAAAVANAADDAAQTNVVAGEDAQSLQNLAADLQEAGLSLTGSESPAPLKSDELSEADVRAMVS